ncbi:MAG: Thymidylate kinase [Ignavibacteriaceae bacterium]|nr:Thymidylate kinase [Ignavibacteriaceae bacterium]MCK6613125.1 dTMP kinase [Ignavibacteriaceae bacterium]
MFITFEGIDFSGKSTQIQLLKEHLTAKGRDVLVIREPGGGEIEEKIRTILLDKKNLEMTSETEILLFSASRAQLVRKTILPSLERGTIVISDRFHDSTTAYQGYGRQLPLEMVKKISEFAIQEAVPDITFFIDIPVEEARKRKLAHGQESLDRIENMNDDFYSRVRNGYLEIAKSESRFRVVNGCEKKDEVHAMIVNELQKAGLHDV